MKKKLLAVGLSLAMIFAVTACGSGTDKQSDAASASAGSEKQVSGDLYISAASSMTESLDKVIANFNKTNPDCNIIATYDSSGTLKTQIQEGAPCDIFISAAPKQMNELDGSSEECTGENYVLQGTRVDLLENTAVLVTSRDNKAGIASWDDFVKKLRTAQSSDEMIFCMGNADVPVGEYTSRILKNLGIDENDLVSRGIVTYGSNAKEVTSQVQSGAADCGILYSTDAYSADMTPAAAADADLAGKILYPAAVMQAAENREAAEAFLAYLQTADAMAEFTGVGFKAVQ